MAAKTITIDMEAYELLSKLKRGNESFSRVIKNILSKESKTAERLLENIDKCLPSTETLANIEKIIEDRADCTLDSPIIESE